MPHGGAKPHMVQFSPQHDYAFIANVASGHVYVMRASDREIVYNEDLGQQAHAAVPSPNGKRALVANQNDKKLTEILAAYGKGTFKTDRVLDPLGSDYSIEDLLAFVDAAKSGDMA